MIKIKQKKIIICLFILSIISVLNLYNAKYLNNLYTSFYIKQTIFFIIGFIILYFNKYIKNILKFKWLYIFSIFLLILVLIIGKSINGSKAWLNLKIISFQPSELMKLLLPIQLYLVLNTHNPIYKKLLMGLFYTVIPSILVFLEPDTGAIIFYLLFFCIFTFKLKLTKKFYLILFSSFSLLIAGLLFLYFFKTNLFINIFGTSIFYRIDRIINFKNNYQLNLSLISIYSSNIFRNGFNNIKIYIPEGHTDFIFSFIIGSYGLIMVPIIFTLYLIIITNLITKKTNYLKISFIYMLLMQILINISMNIGLIPIIGINLPFLSYGGSNILIYFIYLAYIFNMDNSY